MRVLTKLIYGIFSFNPCNPKKGYKDQKIPLLSMKDLFLYTMPAYYFYSNRRAHRCIILLKKNKENKAVLLVTLKRYNRTCRNLNSLSTFHFFYR